jgi:hypothetical protein
MNQSNSSPLSSITISLCYIEDMSLYVKLVTIGSLNFKITGLSVLGILGCPLSRHLYIEIKRSDLTFLSLFGILCFNMLHNFIWIWSGPKKFEDTKRGNHKPKIEEEPNHTMANSSCSTGDTRRVTVKRHHLICQVRVHMYTWYSLECWYATETLLLFSYVCQLNLRKRF